MPCLACGQQIAPGRTLCDNCNTPAGAPPVRPEVRTYALRALGVATCLAVALTALFQLTAGLWPLVGRAMAERALRADDPDLLTQAALTELVVTLPLAAVWMLGRIDLRAYRELPIELAGPADFQRYVDYYTDSLLRSLPGPVAGMVAAVALIILIWRISGAQEARIRRGAMAAPIIPGMSLVAPPVPREDGGTIRA